MNTLPSDAPHKALHRFYVDIWALDAPEAWLTFWELVRDGVEALETHGVARMSLPAPWDERIDLFRRVNELELALRDFTDPHGDEVSDADDCPPQGIARWDTDHVNFVTIDEVF